MAHYDFTILGAGIFGLSIAWELVRAGARIKIIDPAGVGQGASGGVLGALAPHIPENWNEKKAFQLRSLIRAESFWNDVDVHSGQSSGYARIGRLQPLVNERAVQRALSQKKAASEHWLEGFLWNLMRDEKGPLGLRSPSGYFLYDSLSARINPRAAISSLQGALWKAGAEISRGGDLEGVVIHAKGVEGLAELSNAFGAPIGSAEKGQSAIITGNFSEGMPQLFMDGMHIVPHSDGALAIGSTSERNFEHLHPDVLLNTLIQQAYEKLPELKGAKIVAKWAGLRPRAITRAPVLGSWPGREGHFVANGGFKIGFGMAPEIARVSAGYLLSGIDEIPDSFRVESAIEKARSQA